MVSIFQWKPFWLAIQRDPQNDWTATQNRVNYDVFAQAPLANSQLCCQFFRSQGLGGMPVLLGEQLIVSGSGKSLGIITASSSAQIGGAGSSTQLQMSAGKVKRLYIFYPYGLQVLRHSLRRLHVNTYKTGFCVIRSSFYVLTCDPRRVWRHHPMVCTPHRNTTCNTVTLLLKISLCIH